MIYKLTKNDFKKCFQFAVKYHLEPKKGNTSRTSGTTRGLGQEIDSFLGGKLIEIAVVNILKQFNKGRDYQLNFNIENTNKVKDQPDIIKIIEGTSERNPNLFIEIKRSSESDRWIGPTEEQFSTIKKIAGSLPKVFIIGANIIYNGKHNAKEQDLLGCYLKFITKNDLFKSFGKLKNFSISIDFIISGSDLEKYGARHPKGDLFFETNIFEETTPRTTSNIKNEKSNIRRIKEYRNSKIPPYAPAEKIQIDADTEIDFPIPQNFYPLKFSGEIALYEKINDKSRKMYIKCLRDTKVTSSLLGEFNLRKNRCYEYNIATLGRNPVMARNNILIPRRKILYLIKEGAIKKPKDYLEHIVKNI